jgi:hypothetical protein
MLDKSIKYGKENRKEYTKSQAFDRSCRHGGSCSYCAGNRVFASKRRAPADFDTQENYVMTEFEQADPTDSANIVSLHADEQYERLVFDAWADIEYK